MEADWRPRAARRLRVATVALALGLALGSGTVPARWSTDGGDELVAVPAGLAFAGEDMCDGDPIFTIGRERLNVVVSVPRRAVRHIDAAHPVVVTILAPAGVTSSQIAYTGEFAERGVIKYNQSTNATSADYRIHVQVAAPDGPGHSRYPVVVTATSRTQSVTSSGTSSQTINTFVSVPRS